MELITSKINEKFEKSIDNNEPNIESFYSFEAQLSCKKEEPDKDGFFEYDYCRIFFILFLTKNKKLY